MSRSSSARMRCGCARSTCRATSLILDVWNRMCAVAVNHWCDQSRPVVFSRYVGSRRAVPVCMAAAAKKGCTLLSSLKFFIRVFACSKIHPCWNIFRARLGERCIIQMVAIWLTCACWKVLLKPFVLFLLSFHFSYPSVMLWCPYLNMRTYWQLSSMLALWFLSCLDAVVVWLCDKTPKHRYMLTFLCEPPLYPI